MADTPNLIEATSNRPQVLVAAHLADAETTILSNSGQRSVSIATATVCNTSGSARTVELSVVKATGSAGASNRVAIIPLEPGESSMVEELVSLMLGPGDFISGLASAATSVAIVITGAVSS